MALISKPDLLFTDYRWNAYPSDDPRVTGKPDNTLLNRHEGYEVLYFINKFCETHGLKQKASGTKIEKMLRNHLPGNIRSQQEIAKWVANSWKSFQ